MKLRLTGKEAVALGPCRTRPARGQPAAQEDVSHRVPRASWARRLWVTSLSGTTTTLKETKLNFKETGNSSADAHLGSR